MSSIAKNFREKHFTFFVGIVTTLVALATLCSGVLPATAQTPAQVGQWEGPISWPWVSIHMIHLPSGKILFFDGPPEHGGLTATLWNPTDGAFTAVPNGVTDLFCVGHAYLPDGRPLIVGGNLIPGAGLVDSNIFDEQNNTWTLTAPMANMRWYPSVTTLPDGRILVMSGSNNCETCIVDIPEIYDSTTNSWEPLNTAKKSLPLYPHTFVLPDGRVFVSSASRQSIVSAVLNVATETWSNVDSSHNFDAHSAVMYAPGKIMKSGTSADVGVSTADAKPTTYVIDMNQPTPTWRSVAEMKNQCPGQGSRRCGRAFHTLTSLPDGTVLATGGGYHVDGINTAFAVFEAELWSPTTETWTTMASMQTPRLYHGNALLLPDGRVVVSGGGRFGTEPQFSAEFFSPPYLFKGSRPTITSAPGAGIYGATVFVGTPDAIQIASVSFIALGAATHGFDYNQRFLNLSFSQTSGGLNVQMPANANLATPGYYMLFLLNSAGVPSVAKIMLVGADSDGDGLPDAWERTFLGNLASGATSDPDADGATNAQELAAGSRPNVVDSDGDGYSDGAEIAAGSDPRNPISIPIPLLAVNPISVSASGAQNGANPASQQVSITNPSIGTLNWSATTNQPWMGVNPNSGTAPGSVTVSFFTAGLGTGTYNGAITINAPGASGSPKSIPVTLTVTPSAANGTAASYGFEQGSGTLAVDSSGNANNGTITNGSWTAGKYGNALSFNGSSSFITVPDAPTLDLTAAGSVEAWVRMSTASRWNAVLAKGNSNSDPAHNYAIEINDANRVLCILGNGTAANVVTSAAVLAANTFYHIACTWNGATIALYINGALNASGSQSIVPAANTWPLYIGQYGGNVDWFAGVIDELRIYNSTRTVTQIQQDMNTPLGVGTPDTTPPTAPTSLGATPVSVSQINLSWTAATDNVGVTGYQVERCQSAGCSNFAQVGTSTGTTFNDTGLQASTPYRYRVRAVDGATNPSPYSNTASATTLAPPPPDTTPPTAPSNLGATAFSASQINLSWTASTDNVGVTGYRIERCQGSGCSNFVQIAAPAGTGTTYNDSTGLQPATPYSYRVRAVDAATNPSNYSNTASATTPAAPTGLMAAYGFNEGLGTSVTDSSGNANNGTITVATWTTQGQFGNALSFNPNSNPVTIVTIPDSASLDLGSTGTIEAWVRLTSINRWQAVMAKGNTNSDPAQNYAIEINPSNRVICYLGNGSSATTLTSTSTLAANTFYHLACTWNGATLALYINGALNASVGQGITPAGNISPFYIGQFGGNVSRFAGIIDEVRIYNRALTITQVQQDMNTPVGGAPTPDTTPPTAPAGLVATAVSASQINLSWTASTDNVGVTGYRVERCQNAGCSNFAQVGTPTGTTFNDSGLLVSTPYSYRVRAVDAATNPSGYSNIASATTLTPPPPDTTPPTAPSNLTATAVGAGQINLGWTASTDNVGVTGYRVERCSGAGCSNFAQIATPTGTTYNDTTNLQPSTSYSYRVRAVDAVPNLSGYSNVASATTQAASTGLVASYPFSEGAGTTTADHSGNANHGTITAPTWTAQGKFGNALSFNPNSNPVTIVTIPDAATLDLSIAGTIEAWVWMSTAGQWNSVLAKGSTNSDQAHNYAMEIDTTNRVLCILGNGNSSLVVRSATALSNTTFYHVACTWDGATVSLYVNGALNASSDQTIAPNGNTSPLYIGQFGGNSDRFAGTIDEVRIYNRALSPTEIQQDSTTPIP